MTISPAEFQQASSLAREGGEELLSRLEWLTIKPQRVVDMGCGIGEMAWRLQARYPEASIIALDSDAARLQHGKQDSQSFFSTHKDKPVPAYLCADSANLPFSNHSVDLIFANLLLPWCEDFNRLLKEWRRVLAPHGVLLLTALGPDTLQSVSQTFALPLIPQLLDMHDVGDMLMKHGFAEPVLDVNYYTLAYREKKTCFHELQASEMCLPASAALCSSQTNENVEALFEVVFAHAFAPEESKTFSASADGDVRVPLSKIQRESKS